MWVAWPVDDYQAALGERGTRSPRSPSSTGLWALGLEVRVCGSFRLVLFLTRTSGQVPIAL